MNSNFFLNFLRSKKKLLLYDIFAINDCFLHNILVWQSRLLQNTTSNFLKLASCPGRRITHNIYPKVCIIIAQRYILSTELRFCDRCMVKTYHEITEDPETIYTYKRRRLYRCKECGHKSFRRGLRPSAESVY
jgi:hypothetical protein